MAVLVVEHGRGKGRTLPVAPGRPLVVGRERSCELVVTGDLMVSRRHCEIAAGADGLVTIEDLESSNGTTVNGHRLKPGRKVRLEIEDRVRLGGLVLTLGPDGAGERKGELTGQRLGGYLLEDRIGRGAMGMVYRARQLSLDRTVALKILARDLASDPKRVEMFVAEAKAAGRLNHPNIVAVFDVGSDRGLHFFSMEHMDRGSVEDLLQTERRPSLEGGLEVALDAARGLVYAERQGLVHRDIKPANLMVNAEGQTKIGDLGIARTAVDEATDEICGSPLYIAPEQARGLAVDHRADLYSLGVTLFQVFAGRVPFDGASIRQILQKHVEEAPARLDQVQPDAPAPLADLVEHLLQKRPEDRPQSAVEVVERLEAIKLRFVEGATGGDLPRADPAAPPTDAGRRALRIGLAVLTVLVLGALVWRLRARPTPDPANGRSERSAREAAAPAAPDPAALRRRSATAALSAAHGYAKIHVADDLEGVQTRYEAVATRFTDVLAVAAEARTRAVQVAGLLEERRRREQARVDRESAARAEAARLQTAIRRAKAPELPGLEAEIRAAESRFAGALALPAIAANRKEIAARLSMLVGDLETAAEKAIAARRFDRARALATELAGWTIGAEKLQPIAKAIRAQADDAERAWKENEEAARAARREEERAQLAEADATKLRAALRYAEVREAVRAASAAFEDPETRTLAGDRVAFLDAADRALGAIRTQITTTTPPRLEIPIARYRGIAVDADDRLVTFEAKGETGISIGRTYRALGAKVLVSYALKLGLDPEVRLGLAQLAHDLGDDDLARELLGRLARRSETKARAQRALDGGLASLGGP